MTAKMTLGNLKMIFHICLYCLKRKIISREILTDSEDNLTDCAEEFLQLLTFSNSDKEIINKGTLGQHKKKTWHEMRHVLVTGKIIKALYTRQKL